MNYQVENTDDASDISPELARLLLGKLEGADTVCLSDIVSVESMSAGKCLPANIRNQVTTTPSRHGRSLVIDYLRSVGGRDVDPDSKIRLCEFLLKRLNTIKEVSILQYINTINSDLDTLNKIHLPRSVKNNNITPGAELVTDLNVSHFTNNGSINAILGIENIGVIKAISKMPKDLPFVLLPYIKRLAEDRMPSTNIGVRSYPGSLGEYMGSIIKYLNDIGDTGLDQAIIAVKQDIDYIKMYPMDKRNASTYQHDLNLLRLDNTLFVQ